MKEGEEEDDSPSTRLSIYIYVPEERKGGRLGEVMKEEVYGDFSPYQGRHTRRRTASEKFPA